ncbi:thyroid receptor-interacting protein 11-like isoform X2 [Pollicipes pollicipes]|uniref:thyroid receptor-interacting protein 11-like isoform X2 n=1 Tax=Pollicipes pollicipes TaxID=41117 RepID=UPI001884E912|nr:thyroid receptor-interacting protein 11-like isoform X2 [Pollicipes pollicipes]
MAWFGESFSNIKGQLSNIAKEVLAEGADEVDDQETQLKVANDKIKTLEASCTSHCAEISRLEQRNGELEERLSTADLQLSSLSQQHRQEIVSRERELLSLRNQLRDVEEERYLSGSGRTTPPDPDPYPDPFGASSELDDLLGAQQRVNQLTARVAQLSKERDQLLKQAEPDHHGVPDRGRLQARVQGDDEAVRDAPDGGATQPVAAGPDADAVGARLKQLATENEDLLTSLQKITAEREALSASLQERTAENDQLLKSLQDVSAERDSVSARLQELVVEKDELLASLKELDVQNQAANDQVQRLHADATTRAAAADELGQQLLKSQQDARLLEQARDELVQKLKLQGKEAASLTSVRDELLEKLRQKEQEAASLLSARDELLEKVQEKESTAGDELLLKSQEWEREATALATARDELQHRLQEMEQEAASLTSARDELLEKLQQKEQETTSLLSANDNLQEKVREKESTASDELLLKSQEWEREATTLATAKNELQNRLQEMEQEAASLTSARDELLKKLQLKEQETSSLTSARDELAEKLQEESTGGQELLLKLQNWEREATSLTALKDELRQQLLEKELEATSLKSARDELQEKLRQKEGEAALLVKETESATKEEIQQHLLDKQMFEKAKCELEQKIAERDAEIIRLTVSKDSVTEALQEHEAVAALREELLQAREVEVATLKEAGEQAMLELREKSAEKAKLMTEVDELKRALKCAEDGQKATVLILKKSEDALEKMNAQNMELQAQNDTLQTSISENVQSHKAVNEEMAGLKTRLSKFENEGVVVKENLYHLSAAPSEQSQTMNDSSQGGQEALLSRIVDLEAMNLELEAELSRIKTADLNTADHHFSAVEGQTENGQHFSGNETAITSLQNLQTQLEAEQRRAAEASERCSELRSLNDTLQDTVKGLTERVESLESERDEQDAQLDTAEPVAAENRQIAIRLLEIMTLFNSEEIYASNSCTAALLDSLETSLKELQWSLQETGRQLEQERRGRVQLQERLQELEQEQLLCSGSSDKLETISEDAERVAELEEEVTRLRQTPDPAPDSADARSREPDPELDRLAADRHLLTRQLEETRLERDEAAQRALMLQEQLDAADGRNEQEEQLRYEKEELDIKLQIQDAELAELRVRLRNEEKRAAECAEEIVELSKLHAELAAVRLERETLSRRVSIMEKEMQEQHDNALSEKDKLNMSIQESDRRMEKLILQIEEQKSKNSEVIRQFESVHQELSKHKGELLTSQEKCRQLEAELETCRQSSEQADLITKAEVSQAGTTEAPADASDKERQDVDTKEVDEVEAEAEASPDPGRLSSLLESADELRRQLDEQAEARRQLAAERDVWLTERHQLITALSQKHAESLQYHAEIQRLQAAQAGAEQARAAELRDSAERHDQLTAQLQLVASELAQTRRARDEALAQASQLRPAQDQLLIELQERNAAIQDLRQQAAQQEETERRLQVELRRLRDHLVAIEENYTQDALNAEQREAALRERLSSELHLTAESEAASQQIESLQEQLTVVSHQRDDVTLQLDDVTHSLTNLQRVLEQFQRDKRREIEMATSAAQRETAQLTQHVDALKTQLKEASEGLAAANRLNEQLDRKEELIVALKADVEAKVDAMVRLQAEMEELKGNTSGKVDKSLVKNLVVGYVAAPAGHEREVLRVIATVLDFSREERARARLDPAPSAPGPGPAGASLSQAFVRFLEAESTPRRPATLPAEKMAQEAVRRTEARTHRSQASPIPATAARTTPPPSHSRQSSTSSNLLLSLSEQQPAEPAASSSSALRAIIGDGGGAEQTDVPRPAEP